MILSTHAVAGAAVGQLTGNPVATFVFGLLSHFVLDAVPHWQYELKSKTYNDDIMAENMALDKRFIRDIVIIGIDFFAGIFISILAFAGWNGFADPPTALLAGMLGGVLPDALQFVFWKFKREPLVTVQKFHFWVHADWDFDYKSKLGIALQIIIVAAIVLVSKTAAK